MAVEKKVPRGIRNNNPGNIKKQGNWKAWQGLAEVQDDPVFLKAATPVDGLRWLAKTLTTYQDKRLAADGSKIDTIDEVIQRWAPTVENKTEAYAAAVDRAHPKGRFDTLDLHDYDDMKPLMKAIVRHENGVDPYSDAQYDEALRRVGVVPKAPASTIQAALKNKAVIGAGTLAALEPIKMGVSSVADIWDTVGRIIDPRYITVLLGIVAIGVAAYLLIDWLKARREGRA